MGDIQGDADACRQAGIPMIYAAYGFGTVQGDYAATHSFEELLYFTMKLGRANPACCPARKNRMGKTDEYGKDTH